MQTRSRERQEEYREQLGIDALSYLFLCHADLLHYLKARLIFVTLRDLLIVDYQHSREDEHDREHDAEIEQRAEGRVIIVPADIAAVYRECNHIAVRRHCRFCRVDIVIAQRSLAGGIEIGIEKSEILIVDGAHPVVVFGLCKIRGCTFEVGHENIYRGRDIYGGVAVNEEAVGCLFDFVGLAVAESHGVIFILHSVAVDYDLIGCEGLVRAHDGVVVLYRHDIEADISVRV